MPRKARIVVEEMPHHVTQRGSRRQNVFFKEHHYRLYLNMLHHYCKEYSCKVLGYCLMTNHIHLIVIPREKSSLRWTLQMAHKRYANIVNEEMGWKGHLWQERFYSSPLDETYFAIAMKYVERNPVEAGITEYAEEYPWSSARAHCGIEKDRVLDNNNKWIKKVYRKNEWNIWLRENDCPKEISVIRQNTKNDLPCGKSEFLDSLEEQFKRPMRIQRTGPKKREKK